MPQSKLTSVTCTSRFVEKWVVGFIDDGHVSSGLSILRFQTPTKRKKKKGVWVGFRTFVCVQMSCIFRSGCTALGGVGTDTVLN